MSYLPRLQHKYQDEVVPNLTKKFAYKYFFCIISLDFINN